MVVTRGSKGSKVFTRGKIYAIPAFPHRTIEDPTGAGDTYVAAFIRAIEFTKNPEEQGKFAAMAATAKIEHRGGLKISTEQILARLKKSRPSS